ncbi:MAG: SHOCT domain-containing protein [Ilumatobacteraceae bacterium]
MLAEFGTGQVFWSMLWFFLFFIWLGLLFQVFGDIFRSRDLSGFGKALWSFLVIVLPYFGVFLYLIVRGPKMQQHAVEAAKAQDEAVREYVRSAAGTGTSTSDELARLAELHNSGKLDDAEFKAAKAKLIGA